MIAEAIPEAYDANGRQVSRPFERRRGFHSTFPFGRYVSQPLGIKCNTIGDVRRFLVNCRYVSDEEQFGKKDYWQPPEEFEKRKQGDCEDFALWTWRASNLGIRRTIRRRLVRKIRFRTCMGRILSGWEMLSRRVVGGSGRNIAAVIHCNVLASVFSFLGWHRHKVLLAR
jgi:hypothetical protein